MLGRLRSLALAVIVVSSVSLTACHAAEEVTPARSASPSPSSSTSHKADSEPSALVPVSCSEVATAAQRTGALGADAVLSPYPPQALYALQPAIDRQGGSVLCRWTAGAASELLVTIDRHAEVRASGAPAENPAFAGRPADVGAERATSECTGASCSVDARVGDYLIRVQSTGADESAVVNAVSAVVGALLSSPAPAISTLPPGPWADPIDCGAVEAAGHVASAAGIAGATVRDSTGYGPFDSSVSAAVGHLGGASMCTWTDDTAKLFLTTVSGGGWAVAQVATDASYRVVQRRIAGADAAFTVCDDRHCALVVRVGVDAFSLTDPQDQSDAPPLTADRLAEIGPSVVTGLAAAAG